MFAFLSVSYITEWYNVLNTDSKAFDSFCYGSFCIVHFVGIYLSKRKKYLYRSAGFDCNYLCHYFRCFRFCNYGYSWKWQGSTVIYVCDSKHVQLIPLQFNWLATHISIMNNHYQNQTIEYHHLSINGYKGTYLHKFGIPDMYN